MYYFFSLSKLIKFVFKYLLKCIFHRNCIYLRHKTCYLDIHSKMITTVKLINICPLHIVIIFVWDLFPELISGVQCSLLIMLYIRSPELVCLKSERLSHWTNISPFPKTLAVTLIFCVSVSMLFLIFISYFLNNFSKLLNPSVSQFPPF